MDLNPKGTRLNFGLVVWTAVLVFVLCLVCVLLRVRLEGLLDQYVTKQVSQQATLIAELVDEKIRVRLDAMEGMARNIRGEPEQTESILKSSQAEDGSFRYGLLSLDGELYIENPAEGILVKDFPCVKESFRGKRGICFHRDEGLLLSVPVYAQRNVQYVLYMLYTKMSSEKVFDDNCIKAKCYSAVLNEEDISILESVKGDWWNDSVWAAVDYADIYARLERMLNNASSAVINETVGDEHYYFYRVELKEKGFSLVGMGPKYWAASGIERIPFLVFWVVGLLVILFLMGIVIWFVIDRRRRENLKMRRESYSSEDVYQEHLGLLGNAGSEIRTPTVSILGMSSVIIKESQEPAIREYARDIQQAGQTLLSLSDNLVDITKVDSNIVEIDAVEYDLFSVLSSCYTSANTQSKVNFVLKVEQAIPVRLSGDESRLREIIGNILMESGRFSSAGSVPTIWIGSEMVSDDETDEWTADTINLMIRVPDLGTGWTGTGLTLVRRLVNLMHGEIRQERRYKALMLSTENGKKRFYAPKASILAIDDVLMNLRVMGGMLRETCAHLDAVSNGVEALEKFKSNQYNVIFLDQSMPVMDGMDLLTIMKGLADSPNKDTPIVMLSDGNEMVARGVCKQMGYADFLTEPVREEALFAMLLKFLPKDLVEWYEAEPEEPARETAPARTPEKKDVKAHKKLIEVVAGTEYERPELPEDLEKLMESGLIDVLVGLECCQKNEALYRKRLVDYVGIYVDSALENFLKKEDYENYRLAMRVLKIKSMYIGAVGVASRAKSMEYACNEGHYGYVRGHHDDLIRQYRQLMQMLKELF